MVDINNDDKNLSEDSKKVKKTTPPKKTTSPKKTTAAKKTTTKKTTAKKAATAKSTTRKTTKTTKSKAKPVAPKVEKQKEPVDTPPFAENDDSFGEKANRFADKSVEVAGKIYDNLKKRFSQAFDVGSKLAVDLNHLAQEYAEKYQNYMEMSKLSKKKKKLIEELGNITYSTLSKEKTVPVNFAEREEIKEILKRFDEVDKEIVKAGEKLDAKK